VTDIEGVRAVRLRIILDNQDAAQSPAEPYTLNVYRDNDDGTQSDYSVELADGNECLLGSDIPTMLRALADSWPTDAILATCAECGEKIVTDDVHAHDGICGSCDHNARRSG
jgi:hypothetical protein